MSNLRTAEKLAREFLSATVDQWGTDEDAVARIVAEVRERGEEFAQEFQATVYLFLDEQQRSKLMLTYRTGIVNAIFRDELSASEMKHIAPPDVSDLFDRGWNEMLKHSGDRSADLLARSANIFLSDMVDSFLRGTVHQVGADEQMILGVFAFIKQYGDVFAHQFQQRVYEKLTVDERRRLLGEQQTNIVSAILRDETGMWLNLKERLDEREYAAISTVLPEEYWDRLWNDMLRQAEHVVSGKGNPDEAPAIYADDSPPSASSTEMHHAVMCDLAALFVHATVDMTGTNEPLVNFVLRNVHFMGRSGIVDFDQAVWDELQHNEGGDRLDAYRPFRPRVDAVRDFKRAHPNAAGHGITMSILADEMSGTEQYRAEDFLSAGRDLQRGSAMEFYWEGVASNFDVSAERAGELKAGAMALGALAIAAPASIPVIFGGLVALGYTLMTVGMWQLLQAARKFSSARNDAERDIASRELGAASGLILSAIPLERLPGILKAIAGKASVAGDVDDLAHAVRAAATVDDVSAVPRQVPEQIHIDGREAILFPAEKPYTGEVHRYALTDEAFSRAHRFVREGKVLKTTPEEAAIVRVDGEIRHVLDSDGVVAPHSVGDDGRILFLDRGQLRACDPDGAILPVREREWARLRDDVYVVHRGRTQKASLLSDEVSLLFRDEEGVVRVIHSVDKSETVIGKGPVLFEASYGESPRRVSFLSVMDEDGSVSGIDTYVSDDGTVFVKQRSEAWTMFSPDPHSPNAFVTRLHRVEGPMPSKKILWDGTRESRKAHFWNGHTVSRVEYDAAQGIAWDDLSSRPFYVDDGRLVIPPPDSVMLSPSGRYALVRGSGVHLRSVEDMQDGTRLVIPEESHIKPFIVSADGRVIDLPAGSPTLLRVGANPLVEELVVFDGQRFCREVRRDREGNVYYYVQEHFSRDGYWASASTNASPYEAFVPLTPRNIIADEAVLLSDQSGIERVLLNGRLEHFYRGDDNLILVQQGEHHVPFRADGTSSRYSRQPIMSVSTPMYASNGTLAGYYHESEFYLFVARDGGYTFFRNHHQVLAVGPDGKPIASGQSVAAWNIHPPRTLSDANGKVRVLLADGQAYVVLPDLSDEKILRTIVASEGHRPGSSTAMRVFERQKDDSFRAVSLDALRQRFGEHSLDLSHALRSAKRMTVRFVRSEQRTFQLPSGRAEVIRYDIHRLEIVHPDGIRHHIDISVPNPSEFERVHDLARAHGDAYARILSLDEILEELRNMPAALLREIKSISAEAMIKPTVSAFTGERGLVSGDCVLQNGAIRLYAGRWPKHMLRQVLPHEAGHALHGTKLQLLKELFDAALLDGAHYTDDFLRAIFGTNHRGVGYFETHLMERYAETMAAIRRNLTSMKIRAPHTVEILMRHLDAAEQEWKRTGSTAATLLVIGCMYSDANLSE